MNNYREEQEEGYRPKINRLISIEEELLAKPFSRRTEAKLSDIRIKINNLERKAGSCPAISRHNNLKPAPLFGCS